MIHKDSHPIILDLAKKLNHSNFLSSINSSIQKLLKEKITIGVEIEFYCKGANIEFLNKHIKEYEFFQERGEGQFEYHIGPSTEYQKLCEEILLSKEIISKKMKLLNLCVDFTPKPYANDYGNAMQFQCSSLSGLFQNKMEEICASFCYYAKSTFLAYAQAEEDYERFSGEFMAPSHISYGYNNRSCLIRINGENQKRIECRSPSPINNPYIIASTMLQTIYKSLTETSKTCLFPKIYGNSYDPQYNLERIPKNIDEASRLFDEKFFL